MDNFLSTYLSVADLPQGLHDGLDVILCHQVIC